MAAMRCGRKRDRSGRHGSRRWQPGRAGRRHPAGVPSPPAPKRRPERRSARRKRQVVARGSVAALWRPAAAAHRTSGAETCRAPVQARVAREGRRPCAGPAMAAFPALPVEQPALSAASNAGNRLNCWNTKPTVPPRNRVSLRPDSPDSRVPKTSTFTLVGRQHGGEDRYQGRLAASRRTGQEGQFTGFCGEVGTPQDLGQRLARPEADLDA